MLCFGDFAEKIHQAQAAAAKAKKMALPKKSKVVKPSSAKVR